MGGRAGILGWVGGALLCALLSSGFALAQSNELAGLSFIKRLKLARAGDDVAALSVAADYENGSNDARKDLVEAAKWYRQAALNGNMEAQYLLAKLIAKGVPGLAVAADDGIKLLQSAADKGYAPAQNELGLRFQKGQGVAVDLAAALKWYEFASKQSHVPAYVNLGLLLVKGEGGAQDFKRAAELFQKAADAGDGWGFNNLGSMYEMGWGVSKDIAKAKQFYELAAAKGNQMAPLNLSRLAGVKP
jgi:TPR repeat protein